MAYMIRLFIGILFLLFTPAICNHSAGEEVKPLPPISIRGNKFADPKGNQFFIKGIAYQRAIDKNNHNDHHEFHNNYQLHDDNSAGYIDSLANTKSCVRDVEYLSQLNINVIRVYQIDPTRDHDICMNALASKGIYVLCDLAEPHSSINRNTPTWDIDLFDRYKSVIDSMHKYNNVLGFFAGNEVANSAATTDSAPFVKAAIRDTKEYITTKKYRNIPVGYASNDDAKIRSSIAQYFVCGENDLSKADFFALNMYEWCGYSSFTTSGYRDRTAEFADYPKPLLFSEFGCNTVVPRPFTEIEALYGLTMSKVWSGGIAYEYFQHENSYGMVEEQKNGTIKKLEDFDTLKLRYATNKPKHVKVKKSEPSDTNYNISCVNNEWWEVSAKLPHKPDRGRCECLQSTFSCIMAPSKNIKEEELLNEICSKIDCDDIQVDGIKGHYGQYSDCSLNQRVSFALDKYYKINGKKSTSCDFNGRAVLVTNNDQADLKRIFLRDGRSCETILQGLNASTKLIQSHKSDHKNPSNIQRNSKQKTNTETMGSDGSSFAKVSMIALLSALMMV